MENYKTTIGNRQAIFTEDYLKIEELILLYNKMKNIKYKNGEQSGFIFDYENRQLFIPCKIEEKNKFMPFFQKALLLEKQQNNKQQPITAKTLQRSEQNNQISSDNNLNNINTIKQPITHISCPICGSTNINIQTFSENLGTITTEKTTSQYKKKGHGVAWWLCIGWWWWIVDLFMWIFLFLPRLILRLFSSPYKKNKHVGKSTTVATSVNNIQYKTLCTCQHCGHTWQK